MLEFLQLIHDFLANDNTVTTSVYVFSSVSSDWVDFVGLPTFSNSEYLHEKMQLPNENLCIVEMIIYICKSYCK